MKFDYSKFKPLNDLVLVEYEPTKLTTDSGIIVKLRKEVVNDRPTEGIVIAKGSKVEGLNIGDKIKFENIRGYDLDSNHLLLGYETILGILE